mgnify:CR=1 FL=1
MKFVLIALVLGFGYYFTHSEDVRPLRSECYQSQRLNETRSPSESVSPCASVRTGNAPRQNATASQR